MNPTAFSLARATLPRPRLRFLGRTGLRVSAIGLGLAGLGRPAYMAPGRDADLGSAVVETAINGSNRPGTARPCPIGGLT